MFNRGDKLEINPEFKGIVEITGIYPAGQSNYSENHYEMMVNGYRLMMPQSIIGESGIFNMVVPKPELIEDNESIVLPPEYLPEVKNIVLKQKGKKK